MSCPAAVPGGKPPTIRWTRVVCGLGMGRFLDDWTIAHPEAKRYGPGPVIRLGSCKQPSRFCFLKSAEKFRQDRFTSRLGALHVLKQRAHLSRVTLDPRCTLDSSLAFQSLGGRGYQVGRDSQQAGDALFRAVACDLEITPDDAVGGFA